jgi:putative addiction module component (TIGR02574 family)
MQDFHVRARHGPTIDKGRLARHNRIDLVIFDQFSWSSEVDPMHSDPNAIFQAALALSETERLALVSRLMETMPQQSVTASLDDDDLQAEIERRFADQGGVIPWSQLRNEG